MEARFDRDNFSLDLWTDDVFQASSYPIESLEKKLDDSDFAIAIAQPDDKTTTRKKQHRTTRDNVIFEVGLFIGRLGRRRTILLEPRNEVGTLSSELTGLATLSYKMDDDGKPPLGPACTAIREIINKEAAK